MAKVFITGGNGFVGSHLAEKLYEKGNEIFCLVRKTSNLKWLENKPFRLVYGSLEMELTPELKDILKDTDFVYHVAGAIMGLTKEDYFLANVEGTKNLLEAIKKSGAKLKKFIFVSSLAAAGPGKGKNPVQEKHTASPVSLYGISKYQAEEIVKQYINVFPITIIRPSPVYGPRDYGLLDAFKAIDRNLIPVLGKDAETSFVYIDDLINGTILAAESEKANGETFNISSFPNLKSSESLTRLAASTGKKPYIIKIPLFILYIAAFISEIKIKISKKPNIFNLQKMAELKQANWMVDISKAKELLGYNPQVSLEEGGKITYNWYKDNGWI